MYLSSKSDKCNYGIFTSLVTTNTWLEVWNNPHTGHCPNHPTTKGLGSSEETKSASQDSTITIIVEWKKFQRKVASLKKRRNEKTLFINILLQALATQTVAVFDHVPMCGDKIDPAECCPAFVYTRIRHRMIIPTPPIVHSKNIYET